MQQFPRGCLAIVWIKHRAADFGFIANRLTFQRGLEHASSRSQIDCRGGGCCGSCFRRCPPQLRLRPLRTLRRLKRRFFGWFEWGIFRRLLGRFIRGFFWRHRHLPRREQRRFLWWIKWWIIRRLKRGFVGWIKRRFFRRLCHATHDDAGLRSTRRSHARLRPAGNDRDRHTDQCRAARTDTKVGSSAGHCSSHSVEGAGTSLGHSAGISSRRVTTFRQSCANHDGTGRTPCHITGTRTGSNDVHPKSRCSTNRCNSGDTNTASPANRTAIGSSPIANSSNSCPSSTRIGRCRWNSRWSTDARTCGGPASDDRSACRPAIRRPATGTDCMDSRSQCSNSRNSRISGARLWTYHWTGTGLSDGLSRKCCHRPRSSGQCRHGRARASANSTYHPAALG